MAEICWIKFRLLLVANPRLGVDFESTTINETSKWPFLCFRVSDHFQSTGILELLYADNFMFTGQRSGSGSNFFKIIGGIYLIKITGMVKKCPTCLTFRNRQPSEPIINYRIPNQAWTKIAEDSFYCKHDKL